MSFLPCSFTDSICRVKCTSMDAKNYMRPLYEYVIVACYSLNRSLRPDVDVNGLSYTTTQSVCGFTMWLITSLYASEKSTSTVCIPSAASNLRNVVQVFTTLCNYRTLSNWSTSRVNLCPEYHAKYTICTQTMFVFADTRRLAIG